MKMSLHQNQKDQKEKQQHTRRGFLSTLSSAAVAPLASASLLGGLAFSLQGCGSGSYSPPPPPPGDGYLGTDDQLMEEIEKAAFLFFWEQADPNTGQVKDRALATGVNDTRTVSSVAATGFGLAAMCVGDQRGYQPHSAIITRVQNTLSFLANTLQPAGMNGFFYHFVDMTTGGRAFTSEVSS